MNETFEEFESAARAQGCGEVLKREWPALAVLQSHTHRFAVRALVVQGEMWLTVGDATRHLRPGDRFEVAREVPHSERYGAEGATFWVGRSDSA